MRSVDVKFVSSTCSIKSIKHYNDNKETLTLKLFSLISIHHYTSVLALIPAGIYWSSLVLSELGSIHSHFVYSISDSTVDHSNIDLIYALVFDIVWYSMSNKIKVINKQLDRKIRGFCFVLLFLFICFLHLPVDTNILKHCIFHVDSIQGNKFIIISITTRTNIYIKYQLLKRILFPTNFCLVFQ